MDSKKKGDRSERGVGLENGQMGSDSDIDIHMSIIIFIQFNNRMVD